MKKSSILILTMVAVVGFMATTLWATSPHFLRCAASGVNPDGTLDVSFTIAGLGDNQTLTVTASAHADAIYGCLNHGQQCPNAANKQEVQQDVSAVGTFTSGKNGSIRASLTVDPPPATLRCPGGQTLVLVSVSYTNVSVSAPGAGDCIPSPGTFAANFFPQCP
jgi:hypothetical protein